MTTEPIIEVASCTPDDARQTLESMPDDVRVLLANALAACFATSQAPVAVWPESHLSRIRPWLAQRGSVYDGSYATPDRNGALLDTYRQDYDPPRDGWVRVYPSARLFALLFALISGRTITASGVGVAVQFVGTPENGGAK